MDALLKTVSQLDDASNLAAREAIAQRVLLAPSQSSGYKRMLIDALERIRSYGTQGDLNLAYELVNALPALSGQERGKLQKMFTEWIASLPKALNRKRVNRLADLGLLPKSQRKSILSRLFSN